MCAAAVSRLLHFIFCLTTFAIFQHVVVCNSSCGRAFSCSCCTLNRRIWKLCISYSAGVMLATVLCKFCEGAWQGEAVFSIPYLLQWRYVNYSTPNFLIVHRCLPILLILPAILPFCSVLSHYGRCFPILPDVFPFCQCFPFCSKFSILLGVFSFGWGSQNYEQKFTFMTAASIFAWSNQNLKPKYRFRSIYTIE
jgi:hypothetical protein